MIKYVEEFAKRKFEGETLKKAYMDAAKWVSTNILACEDFHNVQIEYEKRPAQNIIVVHLFAVLDEKELRERHCKICKEFHGSFFINQETNCAWCNTKSYQERTNEMIQVKRAYYRELLIKKEGESVK